MGHGLGSKVRNVHTRSDGFLLDPREYFKRRCEYEYVQANARKVPQDRKTFLASISSPIAAFKAREPLPMNSKNNAPISFEGPAITVDHPTPPGTVDVEKKAEHQSNSDPILSDTWRSSPEAINAELPPEHPTVHSPPPSRNNGVEFAYSTSMRRVNTIRTTRGT